MASSQQQATPRGLPGFLRRTLRTSTAEQENALDADYSPSSAPKSPVVPDSISDNNTTTDSGNDNHGDNYDDLANTSRSKSDSQIDGRMTQKDTNSLTLTSPGSAKRHLRAVAFPPLPYEQDTDDDVDKQQSQSIASNNSSISTPIVKAPSQLPQTEASSSPLSTKKQPKKSYKEIQYETILNSTIISLRDLRKLAWNGIPPHHRSKIWKILLSYLPANTSRHQATYTRKRREYKDAIQQHYDIPDDSRTNSEQETLRQVLVDVPRTAPEVPLFHNDRIRRILSRLLYIWAMRHPASSYVQGINDLATPLIAVFISGYFPKLDVEEEVLSGEVMVDVTDAILEEVEADTYWCLTNLLAGIQDHYTSDQPGMQRMVMRLEELVNRIDADLAGHLRETGIEFLQFAFKWMNCLLLREFRLQRVMRLWDTYLSEGDGGFEDFHVYVCASFLVHYSAELQQMGFDELFQFMQNMPTDDWTDREIEILLSSAFVLSTLFGGSEAHLNVAR
eukprot:CAMPEP_0201693676 /NCGR_PEP_ID=MMETSP0578-20130828/6194_1 /ASSEMBLY_ACC=CAM_ASM_000663 /TAXON_ID=267565 /ORGANISM="Skeletonema grethea, Strain CCMP 1804" /LENGTH=504 /DNA_ID=CAMNT_0048179243 /DNA_START=27 /DNA_END=1541 /DNA_ORIENTATION=-